MGQTRTEKRLERALEALKKIAKDAEWCGHAGGAIPTVVAKIAINALAELTEPEVEQVEVKRWVVIDSVGICKPISFPTKAEALCGQYAEMLKAGHCHLIEFAGHYYRPRQEEKFEKAIGVSTTGLGELDSYFPASWIGRRVRIEPLIEEES